MASVYSVGQVNSYIKNMFSQDFALRRIIVRGEVSNCTYHRSGHIYFTLKDESGILSCIMFSSRRFTGLKFQLKEGQRIQVLGAVEVYERSGSYSLIAEAIRLDGVGDLYRMFQEQKQRLAEQGLFDEDHKKPIPRYVQRLGVVTAPTGAAVRDIIRISQRRNPHIEIILYPALVQGEGAAESIVTGIRVLDRLGLDCLIVGRGGGSLEDLWAFNEEIVARAIYEADTPVISAVGHETDTTIADYVADRRASTPSAGAELAVFEYDRLIAEIEGCRYDLTEKMRTVLRLKSLKLGVSEQKLKAEHPARQLERKREHLKNLSEHLNSDMRGITELKKHQLQILAGKLDGNSPLKRLSPGYAYVEHEGKPLTSVTAVRTGDRIRLTMRDGRIEADVREVSPEDKNYAESYG